MHLQLDPKPTKSLAPPSHHGKTARLSVIILATEIALMFIAWQGLSFLVTSVFFPSPAEVWSTFWRLMWQGDIQGHTLPLHTWGSLIRVMRGFGMALLTGIPLGVIFGLWGKVYERAKILVEPVRFIPPLAWIPLAIIFLGGENRYTFLIWLGAFFPILITTMTGVQSIDRHLWETAQVLGANRWDLVVKIALPGAAPFMVSGARLGLGTGWACIVAAEMIGGESVGLGRMIISYGELLQIDAIVVGMLVIGVLGYLLNEVFLAAENRFFPWRKPARV